MLTILDEWDAESAMHRKVRSDLCATWRTSRPLHQAESPGCVKELPKSYRDFNFG
jgi:hypothetical protein